MAEDNGLPPMPDVDELIPVAMQVDAFGRSDSPPAEAVMPRSAVRTAWSKMFERWDATDTDTQSRLVEQVHLYFAINGASPRANFKREFHIGGRTFESVIIFSVLGESIRQFARAQADLTRYFLRRNPDVARMLCQRVGMDYSVLGPLAFDYADYCTDLTNDQREAIAQCKRTAISTSTLYRSYRRDVGAGVQSVPGSMPSERSSSPPGPI
jgi:hypothetical protein